MYGNKDGKFVFAEDWKPQVLENGVERIIKGYVDNLMVADLKWKKGQEGTVHTHPHTQATYILNGEFESNLNGVKKILHAGEIVYTKGNVPHGLICLSETGEILDIFTPMREDFVK